MISSYMLKLLDDSSYMLKLLDDSSYMLKLLDDSSYMLKLLDDSSYMLKLRIVTLISFIVTFRVSATEDKHFHSRDIALHTFCLFFPLKYPRLSIKRTQSQTSFTEYKADKLICFKRV